MYQLPLRRHVGESTHKLRQASSNSPSATRASSARGNASYVQVPAEAPAVQLEDDERLSVSRAYIVIVGPEIESHGPTVLSDGAASLAGKFDESVVVGFGDAMAGTFPAARATDVIYLVAHGDDPSAAAGGAAVPAFGDRDAAQLAKTLKGILGTLKKQERFAGTIVLEGCHSAVPEFDKAKETGPSMMAKLQDVMRKQVKTFSKLMAPEASLAGYVGPSYADDDNGSIYSSADIESSSMSRKHGEPKGKVLHGDDSVEVRRWRAHGD